MNRDRPTPPREEDPALRSILEKTAPASTFSSGALRAELEQTVQDGTPSHDPDRYLERTASDTEGMVDLEGTEITSLGETRGLPADLLIEPPPTGQRFEIVGTVGRGATAKVYGVRDHGLNRTIAVKFLQRTKGSKDKVKSRFLHEARVAAMLEHPGIMPVYDMGTTADGQVYFAMKNIAGCSLGEAIRKAVVGEPVPGDFATIDGRVRIFLKVCDALEYAHHRGFIHQDVKPDNIMLGEFGEVLLLDWGSALSIVQAREEGDTGLFGTPAYMSPEQARREKSDERSDVYCLGATLFHALMLRHPTWAEHPGAFWAKKRNGVIDGPTEQEEGRVPRQLMRIVLKALDPIPERRYQSVGELSEDLKRYQAGQAVSAHRENPFETFMRWYRNNRRGFWLGTIATVAVLFAGWLFLRERIQEALTWRLVFEENFNGVTTADLADRWTAVASSDWRNVYPEPFSKSSGWRVENDELHGRCLTYAFHNITYRIPIRGDIRVEWDARPELNNQNLNCFIAGADRRKGYTFHIGSFDDSHRFVLTKSENIQPLDALHHPRGIELGKTYHFRMEKEGRHVRLFMDGERIFDYVDADPLSGPEHSTFGFEVNNRNHLSIDNIRVYYHPLPLKISPVAAVDQYFQDGLYERALAKYRDLRRVYADNPIAENALFNEARCLFRLDSLRKALQALERFEQRYGSSELAPHSLKKRAGIHMSLGDTASAEAIYRELARSHPGHAAVRSVFFDMTQRLVAQWDENPRDADGDGRLDSTYVPRVEQAALELKQWADTFEQTTRANVFLNWAANVLMTHGYYTPSQALETFPGQKRPIVAHVWSAGDYEAVLDTYPADSQTLTKALRQMGRYEEVLSEHPQRRWACAWSLVDLGRYEEAHQRYPDIADARAEAYILAGKPQKCLEEFPALSEQGIRAAAMLGTLPQYLATDVVDMDDIALALLSEMDRPDTVLQMIAETENQQWRVDTTWWAWAMMDLGRTEEVIEAISPSTKWQLQLAAAYLRLGRGEEFLQGSSWNRDQRVGVMVELGWYDSVMQAFPHLVNRHLDALTKAGRFQELMERFPRRRNVRAQALLELERYDELLRDYSDQRAPCAEALLQLERYDDVLENFSDQRNACFKALLRLGKPEKAHAEYPEFRSGWASYLFEQGRYEEVVSEYPDIPKEYARALIMLDRANELPIDRGLYRLGPLVRANVATWWAMRAYAQGDRRKADSLFTHMGPVLWDFRNVRFSQLLLYPVLKALEGRPETLDRRCREILGEHRYEHRQQLWYETALLTDSIPREEFLVQPTQTNARQRLMFLDAVRADLRGDKAAAVKGYQGIEALPEHRHRGIVDDWAVKVFTAWRIEQLKSHATGHL